MYIIIGGEERAIEQVESYVEYHPNYEADAKKIFYRSRANRLFDKVVQNTVESLAIDLSNGKAIELPPVDHPNVESFTGGAVEKAKKLEYFYAEQAQKIARG